MRYALDDALALPFQSDQAGADVAVYKRLIRWQTPYPQMLVTTEDRDPRRTRQPNVRPPQNEGAGAIEGRGATRKPLEDLRTGDNEPRRWKGPSGPFSTYCMV